MVSVFLRRGSFTLSCFFLIFSSLAQGTGLKSSEKCYLSFNQDIRKSVDVDVNSAFTLQINKLINGNFKKESLFTLKQGLKSKQISVRETVVNQTYKLIKSSLKEEDFKTVNQGFTILKQGMNDSSASIRFIITHQMGDLIKLNKIQETELFSFLKRGVKDANQSVRKKTFDQIYKLINLSIKEGMRKGFYVDLVLIDQGITILKRAMKDENPDARKAAIQQLDTIAADLIKLDFKKEVLSILNEGMKSRYKTIRDLSEKTYNKHF